MTEQFTYETSPTVRDPELEPQNGVWAADGQSLKFAAEAGDHHFGSSLVLPLEAEADPVFEPLTKTKIEGLKVTTTADTGKLKWDSNVAKSEFRDYRGEIMQAAQLQEPGYVVQLGNFAITNVLMHDADDRKFKLWVAENLQPELEPANPTRYGLLRTAKTLMQIPVAEQVQIVTSTKIPAVSADWHDKLPEIVEANQEVLDDAEQSILLRLDYSGARAAAKTVLVFRGSSNRNENEYTFGKKGPVMYWFSGIDGKVPFAVTKTAAESWLRPGQSPDFDTKI